MVIENLTQRNNEFLQELPNLLVIRERLTNNSTCPLDGQVSHIVKGKQDFQTCPAGVRDISRWLDKDTGDVMGSLIEKNNDILLVSLSIP